MNTLTRLAALLSARLHRHRPALRAQYTPRRPPARPWVPGIINEKLRASAMSI